MLQLENICKAYGGTTILDNVSLFVTYSEKIGLTGANGSGKSTLLKIIASLQEFDSGSLVLAPNTTVSYLPQEIENKTNGLLWDEINTVFEKSETVEKELREIETLMEKADENELVDLMNRYARLSEIFESFNPQTKESRILTVLFGLGFTKDDLNKQVSHFSGGWQMRIALAKLLLEYPSLLLLDEPTNHLDMPTLEWLEGFLGEHKGSLIVVSHDRFFLDRVCKKIIEIENTKLNLYHGNYTYYKEKKALDIELELKKHENQQKYFKKNQEFIDRFRAKATKAKAVQSRIKMLDKIELIDAPHTGQKKIKFHFKADTTTKREITTIKNLMKIYPGKEIQFNGEILIEKGDKIAIIGPNGVGKSTLMKIICLIEKPDSGRILIDSNATIGYFSQMQSEMLDITKSPVDVILENTDISVSLEEIRRRLGCFGISGELALKNIEFLSGGEKARTALALLTLKNSNILLLDEPTNHLDIPSRDVLSESLCSYGGTVVLISHDRYFLDQTVTKIIEIDGIDIKLYLGSYSDYIYKKNKNKVFQFAKEKNQIRKNIKPLKNKEIKIDYKKLIQDIEKNIENKENEIADLEEYMCTPEFFNNSNQQKSGFDKYQRLKSELAQLFSEWEELLEIQKNTLE